MGMLLATHECLCEKRRRRGRYRSPHVFAPPTPLPHISSSYYLKSEPEYAMFVVRLSLPKSHSSSTVDGVQFCSASSSDVSAKKCVRVYTYVQPFFENTLRLGGRVQFLFRFLAVKHHEKIAFYVVS
jgi:hypothetical protein